MPVSYGAQVQLDDIADFDGIVDGAAFVIGLTTATGADDYHLHFSLGIATAATSGTYDIYMIESQTTASTEFTDRIDPYATIDVVAKIKDSRLIHVADTIYATDDNETAEVHLSVLQIAANVPPYFAFVIDNNSGQTATTSDGDILPITYVT